MACADVQPGPVTYRHRKPLGVCPRWGQVLFSFHPCIGLTVRLGKRIAKCHNFYVGETERTLKTLTQEHWQPICTSSKVSQHMHLEWRPRHHIAMESVQILDWEEDWTTRGIKESIYIRMPHLDLNAGSRRHPLSLIWDKFPVILARKTLHEHLCRPSIKEKWFFWKFWVSFHLPFIMSNSINWPFKKNKGTF